MTPLRWTLLVVVLLVLGVLSLFVVQNLERTTDLSLDLWVWAAHLRQPVPVPWLLLGTFLGGFLLGGGWGLVGRMRAHSRVEQLEQDLARASLGRGGGGYGGGYGGAPASSGMGNSGLGSSGVGSSGAPNKGGAAGGEDDPWG